jgi:hypothetical protein
MHVIPRAALHSRDWQSIYEEKKSAMGPATIDRRNLAENLWPPSDAELIAAGTYSNMSFSIVPRHARPDFTKH